VTFVGLVYKRKNIALLIDIWTKVIKEYGNLILLIIGPDGGEKADRGVIKKEYLDRIYTKIERNHLSKNIIFTGKVNNVHDCLRISDVFVFPSINEGFGAALIQAMAAGLPCVALNIPGVRGDIIDNDKDHFIIQEEDAEEFCKGIESLINKPILGNLIGRNARKKVIEKSSIYHVSEMYYQLYCNLIHK